MDLPGAYTAERAAALSGVPKSTIHWWARHDILVPQVSSTKVKLWSYADLMSLRVIYWLRRKKATEKGTEIPRSSMGAVRRALKSLKELDVPVWHTKGPTLFVDEAGKIYMKPPAGLQDVEGQMEHDEFLNLVAPFSTAEGTRGPDLIRPRPELRIVPGRISGSPHIVDTRLETRALAALKTDGFDLGAIHKLYPYVTSEQIAEALDLEAQLAENLRRAA
jgi:uncharacterized protein (DUF433 family)